jgi:hypothetical protein
MSAWIISAGSALARAASQPRATGEGVRCIAAECSPCAFAIKQKSLRGRLRGAEHGVDFSEKGRPRHPDVGGYRQKFYQ